MEERFISQMRQGLSMSSSRAIWSSMDDWKPTDSIVHLLWDPKLLGSCYVCVALHVSSLSQ